MSDQPKKQFKAPDGTIYDSYERSHLGGNVYCEDIEGIHVHKYGAHIT